MPKDEWAKEARKRRVRRNYNPNSRLGEKRRLGGKKLDIARERLQRPGARLWFGTHKGKTIEETPVGYLRWLAGIEVDESKDWRKFYLVSFLRSYLGMSESRG